MFRNNESSLERTCYEASGRSFNMYWLLYYARVVVPLLFAIIVLVIRRSGWRRGIAIATSGLAISFIGSIFNNPWAAARILQFPLQGDGWIVFSVLMLSIISFLLSLFIKRHYKLLLLIAFNVIIAYLAVVLSSAG